MGASRPRNKTAWPLWSLAASARVTASAGMSSSAVSTDKSASARLPSPDAALLHKASNCSSEIMSFSPNGPTSVRRSAQIWRKQPGIRPLPGARARTRGQFHDLAVARQVVGALALNLDRGIARRGLLDDAGELRQQRPDRLRR